ERLVELDERPLPRRRIAGEAQEHLHDLVLGFAVQADGLAIGVGRPSVVGRQLEVARCRLEELRGGEVMAERRPLAPVAARTETRLERAGRASVQLPAALRPRVAVDDLAQLFVG